MPLLVADLGGAAAWRYVEFFNANIRNPNTRRAYARACERFFGWCAQRSLLLTGIRSWAMIRRRAAAAGIATSNRCQIARWRER